jgi:hypothetical protein
MPPAVPTAVQDVVVAQLTPSKSPLTVLPEATATGEVHVHVDPAPVPIEKLAPFASLPTATHIPALGQLTPVNKVSPEVLGVTSETAGGSVA